MIDKKKILFCILLKIANAKNIGPQVLGRRFEILTHQHDSAFKNCTAYVATSGEVCQNNWPIYTTLLEVGLTTNQRTAWQAQVGKYYKVCFKKYKDFK